MKKVRKTHIQREVLKLKLTEKRGYVLITSLYRAVSSAVEHCLHTAGVTGSIPVLPTIL